MGGKSDIISIQGYIKTVWTSLCMEPTGTDAAFNAAWIGVGNTTSGTIQAQLGYSRERLEGSKSITNYRYCEVTYNPNDPEVSFYDNAHPPAQDSVHLYRADLDKTTGTWAFYDNGTYITELPYPAVQDNKWVNNTGNAFRLTGEIHNKQDDMPGTPSDPCVFSGCAYKTESGGYQSVNIASTDVKSQDDQLWTAQWLSADSFQIWDNNP
jgi:hypothetical protein